MNCRNIQQLNITCGTDVMLHDLLLFDGETFDPSLSVGIEANLVNSLGNRTPLTVTVADELLIVEIPWADGRNAGCYGLEVKGSCNGKKWVTYADSLIRYTRATVEGAAVVETEHDWYDVTQVVSYRYSDSPLDEVDATIDDNYGEPTVTPTYEHNKLTLDFKNLRGNGIANVEQTVESMEPEGVNETTITQDNGTQTVVRVRNGSVGPQGKTGDSAIFDPSTGNISTMKQDIGNDEFSPMSQKAVTEEVTIYDNINLTDTTLVTTLEDIVISSSTQTWAVPSVQMTAKLVRVIPDSTIALKPTSVYDTAVLNYTFLTNNAHVVNTSPSFATGYDNTVAIPAQTLQFVTAPSDAVYLYLLVSRDNTTREPSVCAYVTKVKDNIQENKDEIAVIRDLTTQKISSPKLLDYSILSTTGKFGTSDTSKHVAIKVNAGEVWRVQAPAGNVAVVCFATSNECTSGGDVPILSGTSFMTSEIGEEVEYMIPVGCKYLLIYNGSNTRPFSARCIKQCKTIKPNLSIDFIGGLTGDFSTNNDNCVSGLWCCTPRFIKTSKVVSVKVDRACAFRCYYYDAEKNFIDVKVIDPIAANTETSVTQSDSDYSYIKIACNQDEAFTLVNVELTGDFPDNWDIFNKRTADGYHGIDVVVNVSNPGSCNSETQAIQDEPTYLPNYGLIALPSTYKEEGKPTRLIIYCHGAGTHITRGTTSFNANTHVDPSYWLAEGYAVMDMDGNPFSTTLAHAFIPQSVDCYIAGYKWAIEHYNLCRDGVFLGGRSMGGGNTLCLMRQQCPIPLIAACSNLPTSLALNKNASNKSFGAEHRGFVLPDGFSWSNGTDEVPYNDTEKQVVINNWDKFITSQPITALITDMPIDDVFKWNLLRTGSLSGEYGNLTRVDVLGGLHVMAKCPLKMFSCYEDPNNPLIMAAGLYKKMFANSGQIAELRLFHSYKDYSGTGYTAHYYELQDPALRTTVVTKYGEEVSNVPMVYVEMLQFWRRYEQRY